MVKIVFIQDFATKKAGDVWACDGMLANQLIAHDKVAKLYQVVENKEGAKQVATPAEQPKKKGKPGK